MSATWEVSAPPEEVSVSVDIAGSYQTSAVGPAGRFPVALVVTLGWSDSEHEANAHLIAAAPDLLEYLERVEALEAKLIMDDAAWATGDGLPRMSQAVYDEWVALQEFRNTVKAKAKGESA